MTEIKEEINYIFARPKTAKESTDMLDYLNDLTDSNGDKQEKSLK